MTEQSESYRRILGSSSLVGGASVVGILLAVVRTKVLAVLIGPAGVGLVGLYSGLISTAAVIATMGFGSVGTRQIAEAVGNSDEHALAVARRAMFWGTIFLAGAGTLAVWSLRDLLAVMVLGSREQAGTVGWLSLAVGFSVASASQGALLQGMRRIGDIARLSLYGALAGTVLGLALLWQWGMAGLVGFVLLGPIVSFLLGHVYVSRIPGSRTEPISVPELAQQWRTLLRLGLAFMGAGLAGSLVQLWIRVEVRDTLGVDALGHFQAAWTISMQYLGFVLGAMGADYYPRLTGVIHQREAAARLVNEQTEIALYLSAPVFIAMIALAPWVIELLYSAAFSPAATVLRWQVLGDVLKVASWPLGFVILAAGDGKTFFWTETAAMVLMGGVIAWLSPVLGLQITGLAFLACYVFYLPLVYFLARRRIGFEWSRRAIGLLAATFAICAGLAVFASKSPWAMPLGCLIATAFGLYSLARLSRMTGLRGPLGRMGEMTDRLITKIGL